MTEHKMRWIIYMLNIIQPAAGLRQTCRDMLSERYDNAYEQGQRKCDARPTLK